MAVNDTGCALACTFTDFDQDNDLDILIANDFGKEGKSNVLFQNNYPTNSFTDVSTLVQINQPMNAIGIAVGDYNEDGNMDYHISNMGENPLFQNSQNLSQNSKNSRLFVTSTLPINTLITNEREKGVENSYFEGNKENVSWGTAFFDFNHDTHLDLFVANGYIPNIQYPQPKLDMPNQLYQNKGNGSFEEVAATLGLGNTDISRGMAVGDYDNDGDLDILVANIANHTQFKKQDARTSQDHFLLYRNDASQGNWLKISLEGVSSNRDGYGAKVRVIVDGRTFVREIDGGSSHLSHSSSIAHFGLADYTQIDKIEIIWPGGNTQEVLPNKEGIFNGKVNQHIHIVEANSATTNLALICNECATYFQVRTFPNPFSQSVTLQYQLPHNSQVSAAVYNAAGILVANLLSQEEQVAGLHQLEWDSKNTQGMEVPFGTYFCQLQIENQVITQKIVYIRE